MKKAVLIVVDMQNDFVQPQGNLYVNQAETLVKPINKLIEKVKDNAYIVATRDWHPQQHCSFVANGGNWRQHCIAGTKGAHLAIDTTRIDLIINKGTNTNAEEYSCFENQNSILLNLLNFRDVYVCGVAYDFCVRATIESVSKQFGTKVFCIRDLTKSVFPENDKELELELSKQGVEFTTANTLAIELGENYKRG